MSKIMIRGHFGFLAILVSGALAACAQTSKKAAGPEVGGASGADAVAGHPGVAGAGGDTAHGSGGQAGTSQAAGGSAGSLGGAGNRGTAGAGGGDAGTSGGGGQGPVVEPYFRAGSRLKPVVLRAGDLEVIDGNVETEWHDVMTGDWCRFRVGGDGVERCLPDQMISDSPYYLDAGCTRPVVLGSILRCDGTIPHYLTVEPSSGCNYRTYRLGPARGSNTPVYGKSGGSCRRLPASMTSGIDVLPLEQEVPLEMFVAVKRVSRPRHPRMNALVREGEDGSSEIVGFSDPAQEAPCFALGLDASLQVCVPGWAEGYDFFSDASCTQLVGIDYNPRCVGRTTTALLKRAEDVGSCPRTFSVDGLWQSAGIRATPVFSATNGVCESQSSEPMPVHGQGAPIDLASLPRLDVIEVGRGPLRLAFYGFDGVPFLPAPREANGTVSPAPFLDVARGEPCRPQIFADGKWRCVPSSFASVMDFHVFYESEDCTGTRAYAVSVSASSCEAPERVPRGVVVQTLTPIVCRNDYLVIDTLELGGRSTAPVVSSHQLGSPTCNSQSVSAEGNLLEASKVLNPDDVFVPMERIVKD